MGGVYGGRATTSSDIKKKIIAYKVQDFNVIVCGKMCICKVEGLKKKKKKALFPSMKTIVV